jgi:nitroreductase
MLTAAKRTFSHNGSPNRYGLHDAGQALAHIALQATALGLHTHSMGGFDHVRARTDLGIPEDFDIGAAVALGYLSEPGDFRTPEKETEFANRQRKPLHEIVFGGKWNEPVRFG